MKDDFLKCKNCSHSPLTEPGCIMLKINPSGIVNEWICNNCFLLAETIDSKPYYIHTKNCNGGCCQSCNGDVGFALAEQVVKFILYPHDGSNQL
jgi:hypothetical protein